jgi:hypothetical protein
MLRIRNVAIAAYILLSVSPARAGNLISNGDFSAGNTGFTSGYSYNTLNPGPELVEGSYSVVTKADDVHFAWGNYFDHTSGNSSGKYFVANASSDTSSTVWQSGLITVSQANTPYRFEAWLSKIYAYESNPPLLSFQIGDGTNWTNLGQTASIDEASPGDWVFTYADGQFTSVGDYFVRLKNSNGASGGNDLGLDDVYFGLRSTAPSVGSTPGDASPQSFSPQATVPEIDPAGFGNVAAVLISAFVLIERRRGKAAKAA